MNKTAVHTFASRSESSLIRIAIHERVGLERLGWNCGNGRPHNRLSRRSGRHIDNCWGCPNAILYLQPYLR